MARFNPNKLTFQQGLDRIAKACRSQKLDINRRIVTSRDPVAAKVVRSLEVKNIPNGFVKFQLPVAFRCETQTFLSFGAPNTKVGTHSHDEGPGIRVILTGSLNYKGTELSSGDWMYIPAGAKYDFMVGPKGVGMFYCYCCCCA